MRACQLIGKTALRTKPVRYDNGVTDGSYTDGRPVKIVSYNGSHIGIESGYVGSSEHYLNSRWDDDNWVQMPPETKDNGKCPPCCPFMK